MLKPKLVHQSKNCTVFQSALYQTNTTWLEQEEACLLFDPNWLPAEVAFIRRWVSERTGSRPLYLGITHSDFDHIIAVGAFPDSSTWASRALAERPDPEAALAEIHAFDAKFYCRRSYPVIYPEVALQVDGAAEPVQLAGGEVLTWPAPGHHADGIFVFDPRSATLVLGDYLSPLEFPFVYHDFSDYEQTLDTLVTVLTRYRPELVVPGHGAPYTDLEECFAALERDRAYLAAVKAAAGEEERFPWAEWAVRFPFPTGLEEEHRKNMAKWREERGRSKKPVN